LVEVCHDAALKPSLGEAPDWARQRPLPQTGLSPQAQRLAALLNTRSTYGIDAEYEDRQTLMEQLNITEREIGAAASELEELGYVELNRPFGCGPAGFSSLSPTPMLFIATDQALRGWNPEHDAVTMAAEMVNTGDDIVSLADIDHKLGWGPRRINTAAGYLVLFGYVRPLRTMGSMPYTYSSAVIDYKTKRFAQAN